MTKNQLSIFNQLRPITVGFDNVFDHFERMFNDDFFNVPTVNYPPYNIVKTGVNTYNVEVALAGFSRDDVSVEFAEGILTIKSKDRAESDKQDVMAISYTRVFPKDTSVNHSQCPMMWKSKVLN